MFARLRSVAPEYLFLLFALPAGVLLLALIPPLAGGNETYNFQRSAQLAAGKVVIQPTLLPPGLVELVTVVQAQFREGAEPPYSYKRAQFDELAAIKLRPDQPIVAHPSPIAVLHPLAYLAQVPFMALALLAGASPLTLFYVGRAAGFLAGLALTFAAIRVAPANKYLLAGFALLPPILFSRSTLDADQLSNGIAFLFIALLCREIAGTGLTRTTRMLVLIVTAAILAQAKSAYLLVPLLALAIPVARFRTARSRWSFLALITLPGLVGSLAWMLTLRTGYFAHAEYRTWSGPVVPDQQMQHVLSAPLEYLEVLARTIFATPLVPRALLDFVGVFGPPVSIPAVLYPVLLVLLVSLWFFERPAERSRLHARPTRLLAAGIAMVTVVAILTMLYLQWTRLHGEVVDGFNGRYLYPLAPLLVLLATGRGVQVRGLSAAVWLLALGAVSVAATCWVTWQTYWA